MSTTNSFLFPLTFTSLHVQTFNSTRSLAFSLNTNNGFITISKPKRRRSLINTDTTIYKSRDSSICNSIQPGGPVDPSSSSPGSWKGWIIGVLLTVTVPLIWRYKWGPLLLLKNKVEEVVQKVEDIAETVEKVAEKVEDMAEDVAEKLPAGKLKEAITLIEKAADKIGNDAQLADEVIDKLQEVNKEMETFIEHATAEANEISKEANKIAKDTNEIAKETNEIAKEADDLNKKAS